MEPRSPQITSLNNALPEWQEQKIWTFRNAVDFLANIRLNSKDYSESADRVKSAQLAMAESEKIIIDALNTGKLHPLQPSENEILKGATAALTGFALTYNPVLSLVANTGRIVHFVTSKKNEKYTKMQLLSVEVIAFAKKNGKWIDQDSSLACDTICTSSMEEKVDKAKDVDLNISEKAEGDLPTTVETDKKNNSSAIDPVETIDPSVNVPEQRPYLFSLKLFGIDTEHIHPRITADDLKSLLSLISPKEKPDPVNLAGKNDRIRKLKVKATNYMLRQIQPDCICNHVNLAKFALKNNTEWNDTDKTLSLPQLKELSVLIVPPERRYVSNQFTDNSTYIPASCKCSKHGNK